MYEYHVFKLQKYELDRKKIVTVIDTTFAVVKRKPKKTLLAVLSMILLLIKFSILSKTRNKL